MGSFDIRNDISDPAQSDMGSRRAWLMVAAVMALALMSYVVHVVGLQMANGDVTRVSDLSHGDDVFPNGHELAVLMSFFTAPDIVKSDAPLPLSGKAEPSHIAVSR
jgi:hypothetical protein